MTAKPLSLARSGEKVRLHRLTGDSGVQIHLAALGFVPGAELEVLSQRSAGPLIVAIKAGRLVLGPAMARHIWVE